MVIDPKGNLFEERRKKDRRTGIDRRKKNELMDTEKRKEDRRKGDRRNSKNGYKA